MIHTRNNYGIHVCAFHKINVQNVGYTVTTTLATLHGTCIWLATKHNAKKVLLYSAKMARCSGVSLRNCIYALVLQKLVKQV